MMKSVAILTKCKPWKVNVLCHCSKRELFKASVVSVFSAISKCYMANIKLSTTDFVEAVEAASSSLRGGHIIAVPTDTIYGIAGLSQHSAAIEKIYNIKRRDVNKPIAISVADIDDIFRWCHVTVSKTLLSELLPGPVTLVFQRTNELNPELNPNTPLVGVRIPDNKFIRSVARACDSPLALTSANISAAQSTLSVQEFEGLWPKLDKVFDGGALGDTFHSRQGSTVVDLSTQGKYKVIRDGSALKSTVLTLENNGLEKMDLRYATHSKCIHRTVMPVSTFHGINALAVCCTPVTEYKL